MRFLLRFSLYSVFYDRLLRFEEKKEDVPLAQLVEQLTLNQWVQGSNP